MPLETNFNIEPYFDDYDPLKDYYKVLFVPGLSVQTRELNTLQSINQNQIEAFADNIFKKGTILEGCNFNFFDNYKYVKLEDSDLDGFGVIPENYIGKFAKSSANLISFVLDAVSGFEASDPDLNTIYFKTINSGNTGSMNTYTSGDTLTIYDSNNSLYSVSATAGGSDFSNTDVVVYTPVVAVSVTSGTYSNGDYIVQPSTGANLQIIEADYATLATEQKVLLKVKPKNADLANASINSTAWTLNLYGEVTNQSNTVAASITDIYGSNFSGSIITNGIGKILEVVVNEPGSNFIFLPYVTVQSANNLTGINALTLTPKNYYARVKVSTVTNAVGTGYAFSVSPGRIYQKGYMARVNQQVVIVEKYNNSPNNVVVGFKTLEELVDSNVDESLLDNALGSNNHTAPGAHRLKLTPELVVLSKTDAEANNEFNPLVEWSAGQPYKQNKATQYSRIGDEMAQRMFDGHGNFLIDTFQIATTSVANTQLEANTYTVVVDPGQAYISGYKTQTLRNYYIDVSKGIDTQIVNNIISLNYGNYVRLNELGGVFQFSTAANVDFYDTAKDFLSNGLSINNGNTNPAGTKIGTAKMRNLILENGTPGDPDASYRLFLFDIKMNAGKNFSQVKTLYANNSTYKGIADVILKTNPTTSANEAILEGTNSDKLLFEAGVESLKNSANSQYTYRTINQTLAFANTGTLTYSIASNPNEYFPYSGNLSFSQLKDLLVVPVGNTLYQFGDLTGTVSVNTTSNVVVGTATTFLSDFVAGDYYQATPNATASEIRKITKVTNNTSLQVDTAYGFANTSCTIKRVFPKQIPLPFGTRTGLTANVDSNGNILTIKINHSNGSSLTVNGSVTVNTAVAVNIQRRNVTSTAKTANRNKYIKIYCGNNAGNTVGPWCLGVPDAFRLRNVYVGDVNVNTASSKVTKSFYIDHNQTGNYLDLSWLYKRPKAKNLTFSNTDYILCEFDYFTRADDGYFDTVSYLNTSNTEQIYALDSLPLANLTSAASSFEVPEIYTNKGEYFDLLNQIDFRPAAANTVTPGSNSSNAPLNPNSTVSFGNTADPANDKKFPLPDSAMTTAITHYIGRVDSVFISGESGEIYVIKGIPHVDPRKRYEANHPKESLKLQKISVPSYPNVTDNLNSQMAAIINTGVANERASGIRLKAKTITPILSSYEFQLSQPMVYTMEDIANLERRLKDVEYYVTLSILETSITNKIIPSSIDGSLNRFKFGFFADDFSTENYSDVENPQYAAAIETEGTEPWGISKSPLETEKNWASADKTSADSGILSPVKIVQKATNRVTPPKLIWTSPHVIDNLNYINEAVINQTFATLPAVVTVPPIKPGPNTTIPECIPKQVIVTTESVANGYLASGSSGSAVPSIFAAISPIVATKTATGVNRLTSKTVKFGPKAGSATLYFNHFTGSIGYEVYKNNSMIASTSAANNIVTNLTANDITFLTGIAPQYGLKKFTNLTNFTRDSANTTFIQKAGKFSWTHNPTTGTDYMIKVLDTGKGLYPGLSVLSGQGEYLLEYPLTNKINASVVVEPCAINPTTIYVGTINIPPGAQGKAWACSKQFAINGIRLSGIGMIITGLKPNTEHRFYVDGIDYTENCIPFPPAKDLTKSSWFDLLRDNIVNFRKPLLADSTGKLALSFNAPIQTQGWFDSIAKNLNKTSWGSSGYSTLMIKAENSIATKLVAMRTASSPLPITPSGNP